jgi:hypothetical protein
VVLIMSSHGPFAPRRAVANLLSAVLAALRGRGVHCSKVWRTPECCWFGVALLGTHGVLTGYSRNTVSVGLMFHDVLLWKRLTVSGRVLHRGVHCVGYLGVFNVL